MKRRFLVPAVLTLILLIVGVVYRRQLMAWFTGGTVAGGAQSAVTKTTIGELTVAATLAPDPPRQAGNTLRLSLTRSDGAPVTGAKVSVVWVMPAMGSMAEMRGGATVSEESGGRYLARFDLPMTGTWTLEAKIESAAGSGSARYAMTVGSSGLTAKGGARGSAPNARTEITEPTLPQQQFSPDVLAHLRGALDSYEKVRIALAADQIAAVAVPAAELAKSVAIAKQKLLGGPSEVTDCLDRSASAADRLAAANDLAAARVAFGEIGRYLIALAVSDPRLQEGWHVFQCPMAQGFKKWFQRADAMANPYMGTSMLTCGSASTWGVAAEDGAAPTSHEGHGHAGADVAFHTCSMHPAVKQDGPGKCPICSMDLTPVTYDETESGVIFVDEARRKDIGIATSKVTRTPMTRAIRAVGRLTYDETRLEDVTLKLGGYITKLDVETTGQVVTKGQTLFTLYSPELYAAQQEYLLAKSSQLSALGSGAPGRSDYLVVGAEKKLRLWGLTSGQIDSIAKRGEPIENVPFASPASGYVIEKAVVEGASVMAGQRLFRIAALDRVWVEADLYESDLPLIKKGQSAIVSLSYMPGKTFDGNVAFVYPYMNKVSRTGQVRIELPNRGLELKPDMYANVDFKIELGPRLQVPLSAVVYTGPRRLVFVDVGEGRLRPQVVTLGVRTDDQVEILDGLREGQLVVTSGNFLVAAESRIRSSARFWSAEESSAKPPPAPMGDMKMGSGR